jgi:hypothetical protein
VQPHGTKIPTKRRRGLLIYCVVLKGGFVQRRAIPCNLMLPSAILCKLMRLRAILCNQNPQKNHLPLFKLCLFSTRVGVHPTILVLFLRVTPYSRDRGRHSEIKLPFAMSPNVETVPAFVMSNFISDRYSNSHGSFISKQRKYLIHE